LISEFFCVLFGYLLNLLFKMDLFADLFADLANLLFPIAHPDYVLLDPREHLDFCTPRLLHPQARSRMCLFLL